MFKWLKRRRRKVYDWEEETPELAEPTHIRIIPPPPPKYMPKHVRKEG